VSKVSEREQPAQGYRELSTTLVDISDDPMMIINPDTSIRHVNPFFERLTGFTRQELVGMKAPYPWWKRGDQEGMLKKLQEVMKRGAAGVEEELRRKDGQVSWVMVTATPAMQNGRLAYLLVRLRDITAHKTKEENTILASAEETLCSIKSQEKKISVLKRKLKRLSPSYE
jgi:PAS domain S-box-containing protein